VMREAGVVEVNVNYRKKTTTVKFMSDRTNLSNIRATINNCGYDADGEKANEDSYKKLPKDCKKVEDGGLTDKEHRKKELESEDNK
jgi:periplasmic mercuric ion binding protein